MANVSRLKAVLHSKCPRCRRGDIFQGPVYTLRGQRTSEVCPHCAFHFEIEPGYFYAAMYVSYAMNVIEIICVGMLTFYSSGGSESPWLYIVAVMMAMVLLSPFNYRYSRVILLHYLTPRVKYNPYYDHD